MFQLVSYLAWCTVFQYVPKYKHGFVNDTKIKPSLYLCTLWYDASKQHLLGVAIPPFSTNFTAVSFTNSK